ncbi:30S ribosomal protein S12 methylthiotransferase RimO [Caldisalinibacter kiritimatiensis]|uniref:Ribosomal protein uS12 methylthiotransferase RimO n=1 Tax=Caldisalinibacter kiritimatiensis TaxID=1304284 RepID=R1AVL4_9FIRM|nr:30S ribosomal protein S12 methylthiotransferase RimO [Caldisalinibacter kiritimatiensis]EOD01243.1 Ribosomal protein S12p Asp88 methylthiotransferase [Caldisalinibacter kiritimatiensis]
MGFKISVVSLGCSKNLIDSEIMLGLLENNGYEIVESLEDSEIILINTCGFINDAKEESIETIIEAGEYKKHGKCKYIIVAGCLSERYKEELLKELPEIDGLIGTGNIHEILDVLEKVTRQGGCVKFGNINEPYKDELPRVITTPAYTAYIKIAEGCNNFCTYCIIPKLRGKYRSRSIESIVNEVTELVSKGTKEIILIAQDTTKYGIDIYGESKLPKLLDELNKIKGLKWIRTLYMYPDSFSESLIESIKRNDKVVNYVDIPIQHINDQILKRMNRKTNKKQIVSLIKKLRKEIPNIIIRTTLIVGFPGETESDFEELYKFVEDTKFDRLGAFIYSKEEGTAAAKLKNQVEQDKKEERQRKILELQQDISWKKNRQKVGKKYQVLIEEKIPNEELYIGRSYMDTPEIDGIVYVRSNKKLSEGDFIEVKITDYLEYDLVGEICNELG